MSKGKPEKPSSLPNVGKIDHSSKAITGTVKGGRITSEAPIKPQKPSKGK